MDKCTHSELVQRPKDEDLTIHTVTGQAEEPPPSGNRCPHVSKLPNEILLEIFMVMKDDKDSISAIARTCHHWRSLVIGAPLFWTNIRGFKHKYTLLLLDRSKLAPLDVEFDSFTSTATILATLNHFERIRTLSIGWQSATSALNKAQELLSNLNREAILLEDLSIGACTDRSEHFTFSFDAFRLTSRLHTLYLCGILFDWDDFDMPSLMHLTLHNFTVAKSVSGEQLARTLRQMTRLEELDITIGDLLLYDHTPDSKQGKTIHLPRLKRLVITEDGCPLNDAYWFLLHCVLPALENLMVSLLSHHFGDYSPIVQEIASHLIAEGNFCNFRSLELGDDCFRLSPDAQKRSFPHAGEFPVIVYLPIDCIFEYNDNHSLLVAEFLSCIRPLDHDNSLPLVRLSLDGDLPVSLTKDELLQLFGHLPDLQAISIPHTIVAPFVESLKHLPDSPPNVPTPYPRLNSILCQGDFPGYGVKFPRPPLFDDFIDCLTHRHSGGVPIRKLELYFYSVSKKEIKALKDIGINVKTR